MYFRNLIQIDLFYSLHYNLFFLFQNEGMKIKKKVILIKRKMVKLNFVCLFFSSFAVNEN